MTELAIPIVLLTALILFILEQRFPAQKQPSTGRAHWYIRAFSITVVNLIIFAIVDALLVLLPDHSGLLPFNGEEAPRLGACFGYIIFTFIVYWWHRARHHVDFLWRWFHQLHHSPARIETMTAYYIHPLDFIANMLISNFIVYGLLGLSYEGAAWYTVYTGIAGYVIHANIHLPRSIGYVFQTPNMHRLHHKSGHHAHNYSDLVIWDWLFGTYLNPKNTIDRCGFSAKKESRVWAMLFGRQL